MLSPGNARPIPRYQLGGEIWKLMVDKLILVDMAIDRSKRRLSSGGVAAKVCAASSGPRVLRRLVSLHTRRQRTSAWYWIPQVSAPYRFQ